MRDFHQIERDLNLLRFLGSPNGTLFFVPSAPGAARIIVRHFDNNLPPSLIGAYASLGRAAQAWIECDPVLARLVRVEQPIEVGSDFIARPHLAGITTNTFAGDEDPPEAPEELAVMQSRFRARAEAAVSKSDQLVAQVLSRSLLQPTSKTFFNEANEQFLIADLKPTREELEQWASLSATDSPTSAALGESHP